MFKCVFKSGLCRKLWPKSITELSLDEIHFIFDSYTVNSQIDVFKRWKTDLEQGKSVRDTEALLKIEDHLIKENFNNKEWVRKIHIHSTQPLTVPIKFCFILPIPEEATIKKNEAQKNEFLCLKKAACNFRWENEGSLSLELTSSCLKGGGWWCMTCHHQEWKGVSVNKVDILGGGI